MDDISIGRLVFHIPGLTAGQAEELALRVGQGLAAGAAISGSFDTLRVDAGGRATSAGVPRLAEAIVESLLRQIG